MRSLQRLVWSEGMLLSPQHLQALDRFHETYAAARIAALAPIDWGVLEVELDSSALALLLAWLREAKRQNRSLSFANLPQGLTTIARLYGVAELLPATAAAIAAHH